ncbi:hypothetical protein ABBQ32_006151 [Trebouxia sp. C0010 RCD-2024]
MFSGRTTNTVVKENHIRHQPHPAATQRVRHVNSSTASNKSTTFFHRPDSFCAITLSITGGNCQHHQLGPGSLLP